MSRDRVLAEATAHQQYEGRTLVPGDEFETTEGELADLKVLGFAQRAKTRRYESRSLDASQPGEAAVAQVETAPAVGEAPSGATSARRARNYDRRDLQAQK